MAVIAQNNQNQEEDKDQNQQGPITLSSGATDGPGSTPSQGTNRPQKKGSGRFTNLQKYIRANQGAGERIGSQIQGYAGRTQAGAREAEGRLGNIRQNIEGERERLGQAGQFAETITGGTGQEVQGLAANNLDAITQLRTGQSQLPDLQQQTQQNLSQIQQGAEQLGNIAEDVRTEGGRFGLLRSAIGGPRYTSGQRRLDQLLLQGSQGTLGNLQQGIDQQLQARQGVLTGAQDEFGQQFDELGNLVGSAQEQITGALGAFQPDGTGRLGQLRGSLEQAQQDRIASDAELLEQARAQLPLGTISPEVAEALGLTSGLQTYDVNLGDYAQNIQLGDPNVTFADVASEQDVNTLGALQALAGLSADDVYLGEKEGDRLAFDRDRFLQDVQQAGQTFDTRFFDKDIGDLKEHMYGDDYTGYGRGTQTLGELMESMYSTGSGRFVATPLSGAPEDLTSRAAIAQALEQVTPLAAAGQFAPQAWKKDLEGMLRLYDELYGGKINVDETAGQLESGGQFNVS